MWKKLKGKPCKIVVNNDKGTFIFYGKVIDANDSFIVEKDRFNKLHFISTSVVESISEQSEAEV